MRPEQRPRAGHAPAPSYGQHPGHVHPSQQVPVSGRGPARDGSPRPGAERSPTGRPSGPWIRGAVTLAGVFLVTLMGAGADSYIDVGLGTVTLVALVVSTALAALLVRRSDLGTVVVAPPLVFSAVALINIALAPSASLNLATMATLLIRGFPAMAIATGVGLAVVLVRLVTRR